MTEEDDQDPNYDPTIIGIIEAPEPDADDKRTWTVSGITVNTSYEAELLQ